MELSCSRGGGATVLLLLQGPPPPLTQPRAMSTLAAATAATALQSMLLVLEKSMHSRSAAPTSLTLVLRLSIFIFQAQHFLEEALCA